MRTPVFRLPVACVASLLCVAVQAGRLGTVPLDGQWEFRFAADDRGTAGKWFEPGVPFERRIVVPGCWDAQGVGAATDKLWHNGVGVGWYRRRFVAPDAWRGRRVWLVVGGVHRSAQVWVNGSHIGGHIGYPTAARFEITSALRPRSRQDVVLAVDSRWDRARDPLAGAFDLLDYMDVNWGGIYEHVWLEATDDVWVADAFVAPDPTAWRATMEVTLGGGEAGAADLRLEWDVHTVRPPETRLDTGERVVTPSAPPVRVALSLPNAPLWTPESPNLLAVHLALKQGGQVVDRYAVRFGLRRVEVKGANLYLNGDRFFLRGYGDDYTFPVEIAAPADEGFWRQYLRRRKDFGLNGVRHHSTLMSESYLAAADEVGMFVQPELPIAYEPFFQAATPEGRKLYVRVWGDYIRQMRNHPSVFAWCLGNEQYQGFELGAGLYDLAKSLDGTRPVIDTDGIPPGIERRTLDYHVVQFNEFSAEAVAWGAGRGKYQFAGKTRPVIVHEMSNISVLPDPADIPRYTDGVRPFWLEQMRDAVRKQHLEGRLPEMLRASRQLQASLLKLNLEAARLSPAIDGHYQWLFRDYWTQSTGFVNQFDQVRALTPERAREFLADAVLLWDRERCSYRAGETIPLRVFLSDFRPSGAPALRGVQVRLGGVAATLAPPEGVGGRGLVGPWTGSVCAPRLSAPQRLDLEAEVGPVHNSWPVWVFPTAPAPDPGVLVRARLTSSVLQRLEQGARVLVTDDGTTFPALTANFKPAWWKGDDTSDHCYGNLFPDHAALRGFPHDGYGDLQALSLLDKRPVVLLDEVPGHLGPIVWCLDVPWRMRRKAYLFEARVGGGCLMVSTMNLSPRLRANDPAAEWMLSCLTRYLGSPQCRPAQRLPLAWLRDRVERMQLPEADTWVEGFAELVQATEAEAPWHSYREDNIPVHAIRQTDGEQRLVWRTAPVPTQWPHKVVTFVWAGGIGWRSQPGGGGFSLAMGGQRLLDFPFVTESTRWRSTDGSVTLDYQVRRSTSEDTFGLFLLTVPADRVMPGRAVELALTATAQGSRRWISVVPYTDVVATERGDQ
jgi:hypothetical protein